MAVMHLCLSLRGVQPPLSLSWLQGFLSSPSEGKMLLLNLLSSLLLLELTPYPASNSRRIQWVTQPSLALPKNSATKALDAMECASFRHTRNEVDTEG